MSQKLRNGEGKDLALQPGESLLVAAKSGSYNVTIVDGVGVPSVIATNAAGGSYGPYPTGAVLRLSVSRISEIDFSFGVSPSIASVSYTHLRAHETRHDL